MERRYFSTLTNLGQAWLTGRALGDEYRVFARASSPDPKLITLENYCQPETTEKKRKIPPLPPTSPIDEISNRLQNSPSFLRIQGEAREVKRTGSRLKTERLGRERLLSYA